MSLHFFICLVTDSLIDQTLLRLHWTLYQLSLTFGLSWSSPHCPIFARILISQFNQNPTFNISSLSISNQVPHLYHPRWHLIILACLQPFTQNSPYHWCFLLPIFHPLILTLLLGYKPSLALAILGGESDLSPWLQNPITAVPMPITMAPCFE